MTSPLILNLRSVLNYIEEHQLPHRHVGGGTGGPHYIDIGVDTWADVDTWAEQLGGTAKVMEDGRRYLCVAALGLDWTLYSGEMRPAGVAQMAGQDGVVGDAATVTT
jgi:hypothetical protein